MSQRYLVFGAGGSIGTAVCDLLESRGHEVVRFTHRRRILSDDGHPQAIRCDVLDLSDLLKHKAGLRHSEYDGIVYAVGHLPPGKLGEDSAEDFPKSDPELLAKHVQCDVIGLHNVLWTFADLIRRGGNVVVLNSVMTARLEKIAEKPPQNMHLFHIAAAKTMQETLLNAWKWQFEVGGLKLQILKLGTVDTMYAAKAVIPKVPLAEVAAAIETALWAEKSGTVFIKPKIATKS